MAEVAVANCQSKLYSKAWCIGLFFALGTTTIHLQEMVTLSPLPVIARHSGNSSEK